MEDPTDSFNRRQRRRFTKLLRQHSFRGSPDRRYKPKSHPSYPLRLREIFIFPRLRPFPNKNVNVNSKNFTQGHSCSNVSCNTFAQFRLSRQQIRSKREKSYQIGDATGILENPLACHQSIVPCSLQPLQTNSHPKLGPTDSVTLLSALSHMQTWHAQHPFEWLYKLQLE